MKKGCKLFCSALIGCTLSIGYVQPLTFSNSLSSIVSAKATLGINGFNKVLKSGNLPKALSYLNSNISKMSKSDATTAVYAYRQSLEKNQYKNNMALSKVYDKYLKPGNYDFLAKYKLNDSNINNIAVLKKSSVLTKEKDVKTLYINYISMGYKATNQEGSYYFIVDNQMLLNRFGKYISNDLRDYIKILALDSNKPYVNDGAIKISWDELAQRIMAIENYAKVYPTSKYNKELKQYYSFYVRSYIFGDNNTSTREYETNKMLPEVLKSYDKTINAYPQAKISGIIKEYKKALEDTKNETTDAVINKMNLIIEKL